MILLDLSDLTGDATPVSLEQLVADNAECPLSLRDVAALAELAIGETAHVGIGGGAVLVRRVH